MNESPSRRRVYVGLKEPNILRLLGIAIIVVVWQILGMNMNPIFLSTPIQVLYAFADIGSNGVLANAIKDTFSEFIVGFGISVGIGIPAGIIAGRYQSAMHVSDPLISIFFAMPNIALLPLFIVWFGLGFTLKVAIVIISAVFPIVINVMVGVKEADRTIVEVAQVFGATEGELLRKVILPASVPYMVAGLRIGLARAVVGVVVAELFSATTGLGALLQYYANYYQTSYFFVPVLVLAILSIALLEVIRFLEKRFATWRVTALTG
ncbi:MAG: ABC transporter permease [Thaumarchaeota archaeon]|nr:ABC transporter permease [Nitrososphaerota archaeon]